VIWSTPKNYGRRLLHRFFPVEIVGQKNRLSFRWAGKASRPRTTLQSTSTIDLFLRGGLRRAADRAAFVLPACNGETMQFHLHEIGPDY
jgi:hypothetical protein